MIPYGRQDITEDDIAAVEKVLKSDYLTQGSALPEFENSICKYTQANYAVGVNSGTSALHLACRALGLNKGDILWTSAITFASSANCGLFCGASIDFVDIDPLNWNLSLQQLENKLELAESKGMLPKILIVVHFCGLPCHLQKIYNLCKKYGIFLIEDACHALGAKYQGDPIGSGVYSDVTTFSFHPVKSITTGEGGMALTNDQEIAHKMILLRSHGITRDPERMTKTPDGPWFNEQIDLGYNYRMTEIQAALGNSQLKRLDQYISKRTDIANLYRDKLQHLPLKFQEIKENYHSSNHLFVIRLKLDKLKKTHLEIFNELLNYGIGVNLHYMPVYKHHFFKKFIFLDNNFEESEKYYQEAISLPIFPLLSNDDQKYVNETLNKIII